VEDTETLGLRAAALAAALQAVASAWPELLRTLTWRSPLLYAALRENGDPDAPDSAARPSAPGRGSDPR
jgi:hypothetical protein